MDRLGRADTSASQCAPRLRTALLSTLAAVAASFAIAACGGSGGESSAGKADTILRGGTIRTMDANGSSAQAIAVKDGTIVYVGDDRGSQRWQGTSTQVVDLKGRLVLPGFVDGHNHAYLRAEAMFWVTLGTASLDAYKQATQAWLARHPDARQVRGVGWNLNSVLAQASATGKLPRELLDEIVGKDVPAVYITNGHHEVWANTRAMRNAGITKDTPNPPGAFIDRDPVTGEPTGILREFGAQNLVIATLPQPDFTVDEYRQSVLSFQQDLAAQRGVTSVLVPIHYPTESFLQAMQALDREGRLTVRYDLLLWADETRGTAQVAELATLRDKYQGRFFKLDSIKIFGTGASSTFGSVVWDQDVLKQTVAALDKLRFRIYIHDIGPTSTYALMLDALEHARQANGVRDARHTITHVSASASPLAARFKALDVIADGHPVPKDFFDAGVRVTSSSDYPVRDFHPMVRIAAGVKNGVPLDRMLASHTREAAHLIFSEKSTGSIEVGKQADVVVMDQDIFKLGTDELDKARAVMTMFNGQVVFRDASFGGSPSATAPMQVTEQDDGHAH